MLELSYIREHSSEVAESLRRRGVELTLEPMLELDRERRERLVEIEGLKKHRNERSREIGGIVKSGGDAEPLKKEVRELGERIAELERSLETTQAQLDERLQEVPNVPHTSVPEGRTEEDNELVRTWGERPDFSFEPRAHWDLGVELGILDFERATKISGARFALLFGDGALLERALIQFMLDLHTREHGYTEVLPPFMVNSRAMFGTGQLPKFEADLFRTTPGDFYLIPTAEVPVTNIHADEILDGEQLPLAYCAYTPCFRSEAGSYGKDVRGLIRLHQFNKVELVRFAEADRSYDELELLTAHAEEVLKRLGLPYRVVTLCTGDLGFSAAKTYDIEVWLPAQRLYREISSCSNFEGFQARRAKIRYRRAKGEKPAPAHTLNGSGLAVGRTLVAILENYQREDGTVDIPEALRPYMHGAEKIEPKR
jgi:seryl-tRNA synthetase